MTAAGKYEVRLDRYESKYIIPRSALPEIREFIRPFCEPDSHSHGDPPEYTITTLQLDTCDLALHQAKLHESTARFKLRARTYGVPGESVVMAEVKRKYGRTIVKSRANIPFDAWGEQLMREPRLSLSFKTRSEEEGFLDFVRLVREVDARPVVLIRYIRESYFGVHDPYARVTFDRRLEYQPTASWDSWGRNGHWRAMDQPLIQNQGFAFSGVVMEVKTLNDAPQWMVELVMRFNLDRIGHCKYSDAIWQESLFNSSIDGPYAAEDLEES
ncbi:MAG: polyphosphate polymerase domain-containing protein [bacterium]